MNLMRQVVSYILSALIFLVASVALAQRSCVFFDDDYQPAQREYDRPKASLKPIRFFSVPPHSASVDSAPDFPNINVSSFLLADQDETSIAINPTDPNNLIIGANDYRSDSSLFHYESFDGGLSWTAASFLSGWPFAADATDPAVTFNASGRAYYSYGQAAAGGKPYPINNVVCHNSSDGGKHWSSPVRVHYDSIGINSSATYNDKYYLAVDKNNASPFKDRVYISWVEYDAANSDRVVISSSSDQGKTWSVPTFLTQSGNYQAPIPIVGVGGVLYVVYENIDQTIREIRLAISNDGGKTFPIDNKLSGYIELGRLYTTSDGYTHPVIKGHLRINSFPSIAVDYSALHHGRIYISWAATGATSRQHIYLTSSDDGGNSWAAIREVENDPSPAKTDKFFPWIAVDDVTGDVGIACYDSRTDPESNQLTDLFMLHSNDGGQSFTPRRISGTSFDVRVWNNLDTLRGSDTLEFFGDYNGLAAHNKIWYPTWTDSRVGYDQDIYVSIVRPYVPSAPTHFVVLEDSLTHLPKLSWSHTGTTTFGYPLGEYQFRLTRQGLASPIDLPKTARNFSDVLGLKNTNYVYSLQVITSNGDTSTTATADYRPRAVIEPLPPSITSAKAEVAGLSIHFRVPDKNVAGQTVTDLDRIFFYVDGIIIDSFRINDSQRGQEFNKIFKLQPDGYYLIQLVASTKRGDNDTTNSFRSYAKWLYAGMPLISYTEDFVGTKNVFTPFAWDTTRANGKLPGNFINDSLPDVPNRKESDSWFVLPAVTISPDAKTLEFDHIGLVDASDSAIVEVSTSDGLDFFTIAEFDRLSHPTSWNSDLSRSRPVHEVLGLKYLDGRDAVVRFRLRTHGGSGDGWFIDSIHFTNTLSVHSEKQSTSFESRLLSNPLHKGDQVKLRILLDKAATISINLFSSIGKKFSTLIQHHAIVAGEYQAEFTTQNPGCYYYEVIASSTRGEERRYGKFVVLP